jgi:hypothetical protein
LTQFFPFAQQMDSCIIAIGAQFGGMEALLKFMSTAFRAALMLLALAAGAMEAHAQCRPPFAVGFRVVRIPGGPLTAVWYPSADREARLAYSSALAGAAARDGRPETCARFPLLVFSHGLGGCGTQSVFFTEQLARTTT